MKTKRKLSDLSGVSALMNITIYEKEDMHLLLMQFFLSSTNNGYYYLSNGLYSTLFFPANIY